jgi:hypothetical protein
MMPNRLKRVRQWFRAGGWVGCPSGRGSPARRTATPVRWSNLKTIEEVTYQLYVLYFDREHKLLYINNRATGQRRAGRERDHHGRDAQPGSLVG